MSSRATILVVDDEFGPREAFRMLFKDCYRVITAGSGKEAMAITDNEGDKIDLILLDIRMPEDDGITVLQEIKSRNPDIEVAMVTAYASVETARDALKYGAIDYLIKPFDRIDAEEIVRRGIARRREQRESKIALQRLKLTNSTLQGEIEKAGKDVKEHFAGTVRALIAAIDAKDHYTAGHSERVAALTRYLGTACNMAGKELELLCQAAQVHDIGKIGINEALLRKKGPLLPEEMKEMQMHPAIGAEILAPVGFLRDMIPAVLYHHERYDGTGYPYGTRHDNIALYARIVSIADAVDAMASDRPYRKAMPVEQVWQQLYNGAGTQFDPELVKIALNIRLPDIQRHLTNVSKQVKHWH